MELRQGPYREPLGIHRFGDLPDVSHNLSVSAQVMYELGVAHAEKAFTQRPKTRFTGRSRFLGTLMPGEERLEICAFKFLPPVAPHGLRETFIAADALAQNHHAGAIARRIEREICGQYPATVGVNQDGQPRSAQPAPSPRADEFNIQFSMVDVANLKRPISMPGCLQLKFQIERFQAVSAAPPLTLQLLSIGITPTRSDRKGLIARCHHSAFFAGKL